MRHTAKIKLRAIRRSKWSVVAIVLTAYLFFLGVRLDTIAQVNRQRMFEQYGRFYTGSGFKQLSESIFWQRHAYGNKDGADTDEVPMSAHNRTLGFGKIYYLSLPRRRDRQDGMELIASVTNLSITLVPGVLDDEVSERENPKLTNHIGLWRASANAWKQMLREGLETALFLDDDADWDYHIHEIFEDMSKALRKQGPEGSPFRIVKGSEWREDEWRTAPYGFDWDILWLGWSSGSFKAGDPRSEPELRNLTYFYPDRNMPSEEMMQRKRKPFFPTHAELLEKHLERRGLGNGAWRPAQQAALNSSGEWGPYIQGDPFTYIPPPRMLAPADGTLASTWGYALTRRGAERMLFHLGVKDWMRAPLDLSFRDLVGTGQVRSLMVMPPVIHDWKVGGTQDSDNDPEPEKAGANIEVPLNQGFGGSLRISVRSYLSSILNSHERKESKNNPKQLNYWEELVEARRRLARDDPAQLQRWDEEQLVADTLKEEDDAQSREKESAGKESEKTIQTEGILEHGEERREEEEGEKGEDREKEEKKEKDDETGEHAGIEVDNDWKAAKLRAMGDELERKQMELERLQTVLASKEELRDEEPEKEQPQESLSEPAVQEGMSNHEELEKQLADQIERQNENLY